MAKAGVSIKLFLLLAVFSAVLLALLVEFEHMYTSVLRVPEEVGDMFASLPVEDGYNCVWGEGSRVMDNDSAERIVWLQYMSENKSPPLHDKRVVYTAMQSAEFFNGNRNSLPKLNQSDIDGVEKLVFFIGYPRSGHSIIGSMMDAHPNMIISHKFMLFQKMTGNPYLAWLLGNRTTLFNSLYRKSYRDSTIGLRTPVADTKGYTLHVDTPWSARFNGSLKVLGDKSGGQTLMAYVRDKLTFQKVLTRLQDAVQIPIRVMHVVRNPYDNIMIATGSLYYSQANGSGVLYRKYVLGVVNETTLKTVYKDRLSHTIKMYSRYIINLACVVPHMVQTLNLTVLEIHSKDFVKDPRDTISRICAFLELPCPEDYLQACYDKVYKTESKSRHLVPWTESVRAIVEASIQTIPFFRSIITLLLCKERNFA